MHYRLYVVPQDEVTELLASLHRDKATIVTIDRDATGEVPQYVVIVENGTWDNRFIAEGSSVRLGGQADLPYKSFA